MPYNFFVCLPYFFAKLGAAGPKNSNSTGRDLHFHKAASKSDKISMVLCTCLDFHAEARQFNSLQASQMNRNPIQRPHTPSWSSQDVEKCILNPLESLLELSRRPQSPS